LKNGFLIGKTQTLNFLATFSRQILNKLNNMSSAVFKKKKKRPLRNKKIKTSPVAWAGLFF
jgi:hypothetical protein